MTAQPKTGDSGVTTSPGRPTHDPQVTRLTSGPVLARSTVWNIVGQLAPLLVAFVAIPKLIHALGTDRFGLLTIAWMVVGYFSFFDLGLGRALTNVVAQRLGQGEHEDLPAIIWTANLLMLLLGICGALGFAALSPILVRSVLHVKPEFQREALLSFYMLSCSVPLLINTTGLRGILEAHQKFGTVNLVRIPMGVGTFLLPLVVLPWSHALTTIVAILVLARLAFLVGYGVFVIRLIPVLRTGISVRMELMSELLRLGGWMTVSNLISPIMSYLDRFLIGSLLSLTAVAYYATPYEVATKLLILPAALVGVLFPAFSTAYAGGHTRAGMLFIRSVKFAIFTLFPPTLLIIMFARDGLSLWLGSEFANHSTGALQWLALGVFANGIAFFPFAMVQAAGRPDLAAKLHLVELPMYLVSVWYLSSHYGITGTAIAWALRVVLDCLLLLWFASNLTAQHRGSVLAIAALTAFFAIAIWGAPWMGGVVPRGLLSLTVLLGFGYLFWVSLGSENPVSILKRLSYRSA